MVPCIEGKQAIKITKGIYNWKFQDNLLVNIPILLMRKTTNVQLTKDTCLYHCLLCYVSINKVISALGNLMGLVYQITAHQSPCQCGTYKFGENISDGFAVCHSRVGHKLYSLCPLAVVLRFTHYTNFNIDCYGLGAKPIIFL